MTLQIKYNNSLSSSREEGRILQIQSALDRDKKDIVLLSRNPPSKRET